LGKQLLWEGLDVQASKGLVGEQNGLGLIEVTTHENQNVAGPQPVHHMDLKILI
jgi:hypothetical protein